MTLEAHLLEGPVTAKIACKTAVLDDADRLPLLSLDFRLILLDLLILFDGGVFCLKSVRELSSFS